MEKQEEDGTWTPFWNWGKEYEKQWQEVLPNWKSEHTARNLATLAAFGRAVPA